MRTPNTMSRVGCRGAINFARAAFTLIEVMVVVVLMSVVILGLTAMFSQTQRAFKAGMTQTDILEAGRMATDLLSRELELVVPGYASYNNVTGSGLNFYSSLWNEFPMNLPANTALRTNLMSDVFYLVHQNQTWTGIGYFLVPDSAGATVPPGAPVPVCTLYRYETNVTTAQFSMNPGGLFTGYTQARSGASTLNVSKILDGVVNFNFRTYDTNGYFISPYLPGKIWTNSLNSTFIPEVDYYFKSNAVPAYVEFELAIIEQGALDHYRSIPVYLNSTNYLAQQVGRVQVFRQRVSVRNVDRSAY